MGVPIDRRIRAAQEKLARELRNPKRDASGRPRRGAEKEWTKTIGKQRGSRVVQPAPQSRRHGGRGRAAHGVVSSVIIGTRPPTRSTRAPKGMGSSDPVAVISGFLRYAAGICTERPGAILR